MSRSPSLVTRLVRAVVLSGARWRRAMTLGARVAVIDAGRGGNGSVGGSVLLVRHSYLPGWYLPGGGVDPGETLAAAACRELAEETGVLCEAAPELFAIYHNAQGHPRDHVALYRVSRFTVPEGALAPNVEIREAGFFPLADLPEGTTPATRRRLAELAGAAPVSEVW
ncbi:NUDIX domain-containing protein [Stappia indica]|uniref:NUDIX domain-containing protein n=1 Tax=Stappia indica TaxID=538381 RepID=UPI001CD5D600|nr:NUDIX domain-containing protein [Stappia indica]MCA1299319.1 NUDIX domain-containing protein [Stappia indica]